MRKVTGVMITSTWAAAGDGVTVEIESSDGKRHRGVFCLPADGLSGPEARARLKARVVELQATKEPIEIITDEADEE